MSSTPSDEDYAAFDRVMSEGGIREVAWSSGHEHWEAFHFVPSSHWVKGEGRTPSEAIRNLIPQMVAENLIK